MSKFVNENFDNDLLVYGNAKPNGVVKATGFGQDGYLVAMANYQRDEKHEAFTVYHHPDDGWLELATDQPV